MNDFLATAVHAAKSAGELIRNSAQHLSELTIKQKTLHDYVCEVDRNAELLIRQQIQSQFAQHSIVGEEHGQQTQLDSDYQWVIDPLDGTTNFLRGIPHYAVSIALLKHGEPVVGVVFDVAKQELFSAIKGQGANLNQSPIHCRQSSNARGGLFATGVPFSGKPLQKLDAFTQTMHGILAIQTSGIRRLGSAALDLAYVAAGRYDGFWESDLHLWDIAAGVLLVTEAGGVVTDLNGNDKHLATGNVLAASSKVHQQLVQISSTFY